MKSIVKIIIVLALFGLLTASSAPAQESGEASVEAVAETIDSTDSVVATPSPSKEPALPPPSIGGGVSTDTDEFAVVDNLFVEPSGGDNAYVNVVSSTAGRSSSSRKVLVIPNAEIKTEDLVAITQDLQVMAHIFHKIFTGPRLIEGIFEDYGDFFGRGSRATESVYLQGYGALFLMEVNIPLSSPPKAKEQEKDDNTQKADSVWQQAQQEIFHPSPTRNTRVFDSTEIYDAEKVEELKSRLIKALKHAANMRNLKPDELIILTAIGKGRSYGSTISGGYGGGMMSGYGGGYGGGGAVSVERSDSGGGSRYITTRIIPGRTGVSSHTVLTIRAKKSDVDAFAKGELDYDKFREKVQILTYPSLGQQVGRGYGLFRYSQTPEPSIPSVVPNSTNRKDDRF